VIAEVVGAGFIFSGLPNWLTFAACASSAAGIATTSSMASEMNFGCCIEYSTKEGRIRRRPYFTRDRT
jgi:hypothetical protein